MPTGSHENSTEDRKSWLASQRQDHQPGIYLDSRVDPRLRGELISLKTKEDRTIHFDFMQMEMERIKGSKPKFNLHIVAGQAIYVANRKLIYRAPMG